MSLALCYGNNIRRKIVKRVLFLTYLGSWHTNFTQCILYHVLYFQDCWVYNKKVDCYIASINISIYVICAISCGKTAFLTFLSSVLSLLHFRVHSMCARVVFDSEVNLTWVLWQVRNSSLAKDYYWDKNYLDSKYKLSHYQKKNDSIRLSIEFTSEYTTVSFLLDTLFYNFILQMWHIITFISPHPTATQLMFLDMILLFFSSY